jgi:exodeoxyribonuclease VII small subunit
MATIKKFDFEKSLSQLEEIVEELESGNLSLDEAIAKFKTGSELSRLCLEQLKSVKIKINECLGEEKGKLKKREINLETDE